MAQFAQQSYNTGLLAILSHICHCVQSTKGLRRPDVCLVPALPRMPLGMSAPHWHLSRTSPARVQSGSGRTSAMRRAALQAGRRVRLDAGPLPRRPALAIVMTASLMCLTYRLQALFAACCQARHITTHSGCCGPAKRPHSQAAWAHGGLRHQTSLRYVHMHGYRRQLVSSNPPSQRHTRWESSRCGHGRAPEGPWSLAIPAAAAGGASAQPQPGDVPALTRKLLRAVAWERQHGCIDTKVAP